MTHEQQSTGPGTERPFGTPQQRTPVVFDPETKGLRIGEHTRRVDDPSQPNQVYGAYLALLYAVRGANPGEQLPLRTADLEALLALVGDDPKTIEKRLIGLMGCTADEAKVLGGILLRHRRTTAALGVAASLLFGGSLAAGGSLVLAPAASADTTSSSAGTTGICNGVVNQLAHRGTVQPNMLKAAAKQNAAVIAALQAKKDALVTQQRTNNASIDSAQKEIATMNAAVLATQQKIELANAKLVTLSQDQSAINTNITNTKNELAALDATHKKMTTDLAAQQTLFNAAKSQLDAVMGEKALVDSAIAGKQTELNAVTTRLGQAEASATSAREAVEAQVVRIDAATDAFNAAAPRR
jgi:predicted  nucleic acid-binding Zn-ribbon protein